MFKTENLDRLRREMVKNGDKSYLILAGDPHSSEYVAPAYAAERFFFAPFSGSDGTLVVTLEGAYLFTDGRYFIQAEKELKDSGVTLMKMGTRDCPTVENFIVKNKLFPCASDLFLTPQTVYEKLIEAIHI